MSQDRPKRGLNLPVPEGTTLFARPEAFCQALSIATAPEGNRSPSYRTPTRICKPDPALQVSWKYPPNSGIENCAVGTTPTVCTNSPVRPASWASPQIGRAHV